MNAKYDPNLNTDNPRPNVELEPNDPMDSDLLPLCSRSGGCRGFCTPAAQLRCRSRLRPNLGSHGDKKNIT